MVFKNIDNMAEYLKSAIDYNTASDIYELPREEFIPYVKRCETLVPKAAIPYVVLVMIEEKRNSIFYKIIKALRLVKT